MVLSPHFDDAVLDVWSVLTQGRPANVINVFAGVPSRPCLTEWDRFCGASDTVEWTRRRVVEDRQALALAGRIPTNLPLLQTSSALACGEVPPTVDDVAQAVGDRVHGTAAILAPAAFGGHPDHVLVRSFALRLADEGAPVRLYADLPYAVWRSGWPTWVAGDGGLAAADADWASMLEAAGLVREKAEVVRLAEEQRRAKLAALQAYETQFRHLDRGPHRISRPEILGFEIFWQIDGR